MKRFPCQKYARAFLAINRDYARQFLRLFGVSVKKQLIKQKHFIGDRGAIWLLSKASRRSWRLSDRRVLEREMTSVGRRRKRAETNRRDRVTWAQCDFKLIVTPRRPWSPGSLFLDQRTPGRIERAIFDDLQINRVGQVNFFLT